MPRHSSSVQSFDDSMKAEQAKLSSLVSNHSEAIFHLSEKDQRTSRVSPGVFEKLLEAIQLHNQQRTISSDANIFSGQYPTRSNQVQLINKAGEWGLVREFESKYFTR